MNFVSHTLVRNGKPFIDLVLRQVIPYANRCLITISEKSNDGTLEIIKQLEKEFPDKIRIDFENVAQPGQLTAERQKQVEKSHEDWILFLDDDDYWSEEALDEIIELLEEEERNPQNAIDGFSVNPYQVIDQTHYDASWHNKFFLKWFKNQPGVNYRHPWPRDMIFLDDTLLYWKVNPRVPRITTKFFHLSYLKYYSFRENEEWGKKQFAHKIGQPEQIPEEEMENIWKIWEQLNKFSK